jgi:parallel beta-helix repeat protein
VKGRTELCPLPPSPLKEIPRHMKPRTIMAVGLTFMLTTTGLAFYLIQPIPWGILPDPEPKVYTPHSAIAIDGDANFSATALLEGWPGNGSPENPFIIDGFEIDLGSEEGHCIFINNTRVSFIISNCNLTGATLAAAPAVKFVPPLRELPRSILNVGSGIHLYNVSNGEIVSNTCNNNSIGIDLFYADSNIVSSNTCDNNTLSGINLWDSDSNTVANNTCSSNTESGIYLWQSDSNTVEYNTVATTVGGIWLSASDSNTIVSNTCNENGRSGIYLWASHASTVANNTCTSSEYGISLDS